MANVIINDTHLTDIADSIRGKNRTNNKYKPSEMASAISNIEMGIIPSGTLEINENGEYDVKSYEKANVNVEGAGGKYKPRYISFRNYSGTELDEELANLDTSNMTSMKQMFYSSSKLLELDLSDFNVSNVNDITEIFYGCSKLKKLRLNNWDTSAVTSMVQAFRMCGSLTELDLSGWVLSDNVNISDLFYQCYALAKLDIRNFTFDKVGMYVDAFVSLPSNCEIIVKSDTERNWILTNGKSDLTNIKTVAEL